jgi:hypothetical protein
MMAYLAYSYDWHIWSLNWENAVLILPRMVHIVWQCAKARSQAHVGPPAGQCTRYRSAHRFALVQHTPVEPVRKLSAVTGRHPVVGMGPGGVFVRLT